MNLFYIFSSRSYSMISFLQGSNNFKEVTIIERLLRTSLTTILNKIFEMRKVKKVNILNDLLTRSHHHGEIVEEIIEHDFTENI